MTILDLTRAELLVMNFYNISQAQARELYRDEIAAAAWLIHRHENQPDQPGQQASSTNPENL